MGKGILRVALFVFSILLLTHVPITERLSVAAEEAPATPPLAIGIAAEDDGEDEEEERSRWLLILVIVVASALLLALVVFAYLKLVPKIKGILAKTKEKKGVKQGKKG